MNSIATGAGEMDATARFAYKNAALEARDVSVLLGATKVLHHIDLHIPAGRWTSIIGPNGAGKSTLLKVLAGLLAHTGEVRLFGNVLNSLPGRVRAQRLS